MEDGKIRVFLTGATGVMGGAGLKELLKAGQYSVSALVRDNARNRKKIQVLEKKGVKVIKGDLLDEKSLREGIKDSEIVLHVGGMVSPQADYYPERTIEVNIESMRLIAKIIKEIEDADPDRIIKTVYIGSVSQYGSKLPPDHWGEVGLPLQAAKFDAYSVSKTFAERILVESGLRKWVSIRQTGILHSGILKNASNPVAFHVPVSGVLEWITVEDSGRLLERVCRRDVPDEFWCNFYNAGGGKNFRLTNLEFERGIMKSLGCPPPEKIFEPNWFATRNFHGFWFKDSDTLNDILKFREADLFPEALSRLKKSIPFYFKLTPLAPAFLIKKIMKRVASKPILGPLSWIKENDTAKISAFFGSQEEYDRVPQWKDFEEQDLPKECEPCKKEIKPLNVTLRKQKCGNGHEYMTSEALEVGGHGCPICLYNSSRLGDVMGKNSPVIEKLFNFVVYKE